MSDKEEFDSEMEDYLAERRKEPLLSVILKKKTMSKASLADEKETHERAHADAPVVEDVPAQDSWLSRLWSGVFGKHDEQSQETTESLPESELMEDFKAVSKITLSVMKQLPEEQLAALKQSQEFAHFKDILKKHNLIK